MKARSPANEAQARGSAVVDLRRFTPISFISMTEWKNWLLFLVVFELDTRRNLFDLEEEET